MSGKKRTTPNYRQLYDEQLRQNQELQRQQKQDQRKIREQKVIADRISQIENRVRKEIASLEKQTAKSSKDAAKRLVNIQEQTAKAMNNISGLQVDLKVTQQNIDQMNWEAQKFHQEALKGQDAIRQDIEHASRQNMRAHEIAQQERRNMLDAVDENHKVLKQNHEALRGNRRAIDDLYKQVQDTDVRNQLEKVRTAALILEDVINEQREIPLDWAQRIEPERLEQALRSLDTAQQHFTNEDYVAARNQGQQALAVMGDVSRIIREQKKLYENELQTAYDLFRQVRQEVDIIDSDEMRLWKPAELNDLNDKVNALEQRLDIASREYSIDGLRQIGQTAQDIYADAKQLDSELQVELQLHDRRREDLKRYVKALAEMEEFPVAPPTYADANNPHSDIILKTERNRTIHLQIDGAIEVEFPEEHPEDNRRWFSDFEKMSQEQGHIDKFAPLMEVDDA